MKDNVRKAGAMMIDMSLIVADPAVSGGMPMIRNTGLSVRLIVHALAEGKSIDELMQEHPGLTRAAISAALEFAASAVHAYQPPLPDRNGESERQQMKKRQAAIRMLDSFLEGSEEEQRDSWNSIQKPTRGEATPPDPKSSFPASEFPT